MTDHNFPAAYMLAQETPKSGEFTYQGTIDIAYPWDLPEKLTGPAVMFDVISASQNINRLAISAKRLYVVTRDTVRAALNRFPDAALFGESPDPDLSGKFTCSNHPAEVAAADVSGKTVVILTNNGTYTLSELWSKGAGPIVVGNYSNLRTLSEWLVTNHGRAERITLVPSGGREPVFAGDPNLMEDQLCAETVRDLLLGNDPDLPAVFAKSMEFYRIQYPPTDATTPEDFALIFTPDDLYPVVPVLRVEDGLLRVYDALREPASAS